MTVHRLLDHPPVAGHHDEPEAERLRDAFAVPVGVAALLVIPVILAEQAEGAVGWLRDLAHVVDWLIWAVFAIELVVTTRAARERRRWLLRHPLDVAIVALSFPALTVLLPAIRVVRLFRLLRLMRLAGLARVFFSGAGVKYASVLAALTVLAGGDAYAEIEGTSVDDGAYWAVSTMTTVGYGDISPETHLGRILAVVVMLVGIGFVAVLTGAIAERFISRDVRPVESETAELVSITRDLRAQVEQLNARLRELEARDP